MELKSLIDTKNLSNNISKIISPGDVIFLYGEIGVGKTTFVRFLIHSFENRNKLKNSDVLSPTFNIVYDYDLGKIKIQHYDLYRLKSYKEILQLGIFETSNNYIKIVEWPEFIKKKPKDRIDIIIKYSKKLDSRTVKIAGLGKWKNYKFDDI
tara:strand:+ start:76 stop:531 length:456 start_codon:yes stop_codon:yes gene_type:complete